MNLRELRELRELRIRELRELKVRFVVTISVCGIVLTIKVS